MDERGGEGETKSTPPTSPQTAFLRTDVAQNHKYKENRLKNRFMIDAGKGGREALPWGWCAGALRRV